MKNPIYASMVLPCCLIIIVKLNKLKRKHIYHTVAMIINFDYILVDMVDEIEVNTKYTHNKFVVINDESS